MRPVYALASGSTQAAPVSPWIWALTVAAYVLPIVYAVSLFFGEGRTPYDRITGTKVTRRPERSEESSS